VSCVPCTDVQTKEAMLISPRQFFPPATEDTGAPNQDTGDPTEITAGDETPTLPDVPTNEPAEAG
jgi:hypothetical protein